MRKGWEERGRGRRGVSDEGVQGVLEGWRATQDTICTQTGVERQRTRPSRFQLVIFLADGTARPNIPLNISPIFSLVRSCL